MPAIETPETLISMYRGDTHSVVCAVTTTDDDDVTTIVNLTGASAKLTVKAKGSDSANVLQKTAAINSPATAGVLQVDIVPADTSGLTPSVYVYDIQVMTAAAKVYTVVRGTFELKEDVTTS